MKETKQTRLVSSKHLILEERKFVWICASACMNRDRHRDYPKAATELLCLVKCYQDQGRKGCY